jgi:hypothetical protein
MSQGRDRYVVQRTFSAECRGPQVIAQEKFDPAEFDLDDDGDKVVVTHNSGSRFEFSPGGEASKIFGELGITTYEYTDLA